MNLYSTNQLLRSEKTTYEKVIHEIQKILDYKQSIEYLPQKVRQLLDEQRELYKKLDYMQKIAQEQQKILLMNNIKINVAPKVSCMQSLNQTTIDNQIEEIDELTQRNIQLQQQNEDLMDENRILRAELLRFDAEQGEQQPKQLEYLLKSNDDLIEYKKAEIISKISEKQRNSQQEDLAPSMFMKGNINSLTSQQYPQQDLNLEIQISDSQNIQAHQALQDNVNNINISHQLNNALMSVNQTTQTSNNNTPPIPIQVSIPYQSSQFIQPFQSVQEPGGSPVQSQPNQSPIQDQSQSFHIYQNPSLILSQIIQTPQKQQKLPTPNLSNEQTVNKILTSPVTYNNKAEQSINNYMQLLRSGAINSPQHK